MRRRQLVTLAILIGVLGSCGSHGSGEMVVEMLDNRFAPIDVTVTTGEDVTFIGVGRNPHNAVAADGSWSTEAEFGSLEQFEGEAATLVFDTPGSYVFFCTFHGNGRGEGMAGTLTVVPDATTP